MFFVLISLEKENFIKKYYVVIWIKMYFFFICERGYIWRNFVLVGFLNKIVCMIGVLCDRELIGNVIWIFVLRIVFVKNLELRF